MGAHEKFLPALSNDEHEAIAAAMQMGIRLNVELAGGNPADGRVVAHKLLMAAVATMATVEGWRIDALDTIIADLRRDFPAILARAKASYDEQEMAEEKAANISQEAGRA